MTRAVFSKKILQFSPKNGEIQLTNIQTTRTYQITVKNVCKDNIIIHDVWTPSNYVFVRFPNIISLGPSQIATITIFICPSSVGTFHTNLYFFTNKGEIPHMLTVRAFALSKERNAKNLYYMTNINTTIPVAVPKTVSCGRTSFIYDKNIMTIDRYDKEISKLHLMFNLLPTHGYFLTFIHFVAPTTTRTLPMFISISPRILQPQMPIVIIQPVTRKDGFVEQNIILVNPVGGNFAVIHTSLHKDAPSNIKFNALPPPLICPRNMETNIGKIIVDGSKEGMIKTKLIITYEGSTPLIVQTLEIPIKASVVYGNLAPCQERIEILYKDIGKYNFNFTNNFKVPVAVVGARFNSNTVSLANFTSFLVKPGKVSKNIKFHLNQNMSKTRKLKCTMTLETNATAIKVPVIFYSGNVTISSGKKDDFLDSITVFVAQVLCETTKEFTFYIRNDNPIPFTVLKYTKTPGIEIEYDWMNKKGYKINNYTIPPFKTKKFSVFVSFTKINLFKPRNDIITLFSENSSVSITFSWLPSRGSLSLVSDLPAAVTVGKSYKGDLYVNSSYSQHVKIKSVSATNNGVSIDYKTPFIKPISIGKTDTHIGNFSFTINEEFLSETKLAPLLNPDSAWYKNPSRWEDLWNRAIPVKLKFVLHFKGEFFATMPINLNVGYSIYKDVSYDIGLISINTQHIGTLSISNTLDTAIKLCFNKARYNSELINITSPSYFDLRSNSTNKIAFRFYDTKNEKICIRVPVTSNATSPFFVTITAEVVKPSIKMLNENEEIVSSIVFSSKNDRDMINKIWSEKFYLLNDGETAIDLKYLSISNNTRKFYDFIQISSNCSKLLPKEKCEFYANVNILYLTKSHNKFQVQFESCKNLLAIDWIINISEDTIKIITSSKSIVTAIFVVITLLPHILFAIDDIYGIKESYEQILNKLNRRDRAVKILSASTRINVETQCVVTQEDLSGGTYSPEEFSKKSQFHSIDEDSLNAFESLFTS